MGAISRFLKEFGKVAEGYKKEVVIKQQAYDHAKLNKRSLGRQHLKNAKQELKSAKAKLEVVQTVINAVNRLKAINQEADSVGGLDNLPSKKRKERLKILRIFKDYSEAISKNKKGEK